MLTLQIAAGIWLGGVGLAGMAKLNAIFWEYRRKRAWRGY